MKRTPTKTERDEYITHKQQLANAVADRIENGLPLEDWQQRFLRFVLNGNEASNDHAGAMREWAAKYEPGKSRGPYPKISDVDAAMAYVLYREEGYEHTTTLELLAAELKMTEIGIWKAIKDQVPYVCEHFGIDPETVSARKPRGRPPSNK